MWNISNAADCLLQSAPECIWCRLKTIYMFVHLSQIKYLIYADKLPAL